MEVEGHRAEKKQRWTRGMAGRERRRERAGRGDAGTQCDDWFAKVVPIGTGVALSLQGFAGNKALDHHRSKLHG